MTNLLTAAASGCEDSSPIKEKCYPRSLNLRGRTGLRACLRSRGPQLSARLASPGRLYSPARIDGLAQNNGLAGEALPGSWRLSDRRWHLDCVRAALVAARSRRGLTVATDPGRVAYLCRQRQTVGVRQVGVAVAALVEGVRPELRVT